MLTIVERHYLISPDPEYEDGTASQHWCATRQKWGNSVIKLRQKTKKPAEAGFLKSLKR